jgi:hypothetical protein
MEEYDKFFQLQTAGKYGSIFLIGFSMAKKGLAGFPVRWSST